MTRKFYITSKKKKKKKSNFYVVEIFHSVFTAILHPVTQAVHLGIPIHCLKDTYSLTLLNFSLLIFLKK